MYHLVVIFLTAPAFAGTAAYGIKFEPTPIKQFNSGIPAGDMPCKESFEHMVKNNVSLVCVRPSSTLVLSELGWR